jgi:RNA polymerase sigma factor (sigma-70 family)
MIAQAAVTTTQSEIVEQHLPLAYAIAFRLKRRYTWLDSEDLTSYSLLGLTIAAKSWQPDRGLSFGAFARYKAMYLAIDEMRRDHVIQRGSLRRPPQGYMGWSSDEDSRSIHEPVDPHGQDGEEREGMRDLLRHLLLNLKADDRRLLEMHYADSLTFAEIGDVLGVAQPTVCLRHTALMKQLRRRARIAAVLDRRNAGEAS